MRIKQFLKWLLYVGVSLLIFQTLLALHQGRTQYQSLLYKSSRTEAYFENFTNNAVISQPTEDIKRPDKLVGDHEGHNGFALASTVRENCKSIQDGSLGKFFTLLGVTSKNIVYCPVEKCATTFWRRTFYLLTNKKSPQPSNNPFAVPLSILSTVNKGFNVQKSYNHSQQKFMKNSFNFMFVRNPYSRVYSAFVDKLLPPNPYFWKVLGAKAIAEFRKQPSTKSRTTGYDVTFAEYVKFVIRSLQTKRDLDEHHISIFDKCEPCAVEFDYIGKMESFPDDSLFILKKLGLNSTMETFSDPEVLKNMSAEDALMDTTTSPFAWKNPIMRTISWETALRRTWLKLQLRGLVDMNQTFDKYVPKGKINAFTGKQFQAIAQEARKNSDPGKLKRQKTEGMREAYLTLHIEDVKLMRGLYRNDFRLFGYDDSPPELFDRPDEPQNASDYFNYSKLGRDRKM